MSVTAWGINSVARKKLVNKSVSTRKLCELWWKQCFQFKLNDIFIPKHFDVKIAYLDSAAFTIKKY